MTYFHATVIPAADVQPGDVIPAADVQPGDVISRPWWNGLTATVLAVGYSQMFVRVTDGNDSAEMCLSIERDVVLHERAVS